MVVTAMVVTAMVVMVMVMVKEFWRRPVPPGGSGRRGRRDGRRRRGRRVGDVLEDVGLRAVGEAIELVVERRVDVVLEHVVSRLLEPVEGQLRAARAVLRPRGEVLLGFCATTATVLWIK
jgi:hypothetical protein